jgi:hypothetical protein
MTKPPKPNDQRSDVKNPNNEKFGEDQQHRDNQKNPNNPAHPGGDDNNKAGGGSNQLR